MELLLNILWLAVVLFAAIRIAVWAISQPDTREGLRRVRIVSLATLCIVALMFPIISMTDDLDSNTALVEEAITAKRLVRAANELVLPLLIVTALLASLLSRTVLGNVIENSPSPLAASHGLVFSLRGPPALLR